MKFKLLAIVTLIACLLLNMTGAVAEPAALTGTAAAPAVSADLQKVAESDSLILYYDSKDISIAVKDKRNGYTWSSAVGDDYYDGSRLNDTWKSNIRALFDIAYAKFDGTNETTVETNSILEKPAVNADILNKGVALDFDLKTLEIRLRIMISLENDSLRVQVPFNGIRENGKFKLVMLRLMPYFGASTDMEKGYVFYPDGSGALMHFKGKPHINEEKYTWYIYGSDNVAVDYVENMEKYGDKQAMLPVYGVKRENNGFVAIIDTGECDTSIHLTPSGSTVELNRISSEFTYRRILTYITASMSKVNRAEKEIIRSDHAIKYVFLAGENASYSGMANAYRRHLLEANRIRRNVKPGSKIPMELNLFMGIKERRLLFDRFVSMTTFAQAEEIVNKYIQKGVDGLKVNLIGWNSNGFGAVPLHFPPERTLGGKTGLQQFSGYMAQNGVELYLQDNFIDIADRNGSFSKRYDVVYHRNQTIISDPFESRFLYNPLRAANRFLENFLPEAGRYGINGVTFDKLGKYVYYDYNKTHPVSRAESAANWEKIMAETESQLGNAAVRGGNAYVLKYANRLLDIPVDDSGYFITDEAVPFYQMVVHGLIPYSSWPGNLFHDFPRQKLKWVEYGCIPYFELTYEKSSQLKYTEYNDLFTSHYSEWLDISADIYAEFNHRLGSLGSKMMINHKKLENGVYLSVYEGNSKVYVNYNEQDVTVDGYTVKAMDYLAVDSEGRGVR